MNQFIDLSSVYFEHVVILNKRIIEKYDAYKVTGKYSKAMDLARAEVIEEFLNDKIDFDDLTALRELQIPCHQCQESFRSFRRPSNQNKRG
jgi:1-deoxy-D-xylulose 5-phosphate reductoisomerase